MEVVEKFVAARSQSTHINGAFAAGRENLFNPKRHALELHRRRVEVLHPNCQRLIGGRLDLGRLKMMAFDGNGATAVPSCAQELAAATIIAPTTSAKAVVRNQSKFAIIALSFRLAIAVNRTGSSC